MRSTVNSGFQFAAAGIFGGECLTYAPDNPKPRTSATSKKLGAR